MAELVTNRVETNDARRETLRGREYLVADVTAARAIRLNGGFVAPEEWQKSVMEWNRVPLPIGHPQNARGEYITSRIPEVIENAVVGDFYYAHYDEATDSLNGELWVDVEQAEALGEFGEMVIAAIEDDDPLEVSTAYRAEEGDPVEHNGTQYEETRVNLRPDHLALLPGDFGPGKCSVEDGCGTGPLPTSPPDATASNADAPYAGYVVEGETGELAANVYPNMTDDESESEAATEADEDTDESADTDSPTDEAEETSAESESESDADSPDEEEEADAESDDEDDEVDSPTDEEEEAADADEESPTNNDDSEDAVSPEEQEALSLLQRGLQKLGIGGNESLETDECACANHDDGCACEESQNEASESDSEPDTASETTPETESDSEPDSDAPSSTESPSPTEAEAESDSTESDSPDTSTDMTDYDIEAIAAQTGFSEDELSEMDDEQIANLATLVDKAEEAEADANETSTEETSTEETSTEEADANETSTEETEANETDEADEAEELDIDARIDERVNARIDEAIEAALPDGVEEAAANHVAEREARRKGLVNEVLSNSDAYEQEMLQNMDDSTLEATARAVRQPTGTDFSGRPTPTANASSSDSDGPSTSGTMSDWMEQNSD